MIEANEVLYDSLQGLKSDLARHIGQHWAVDGAARRLQVICNEMKDRLDRFEDAKKWEA